MFTKRPLALVSFLSVVAVIVKISNDFQSAYISQDWDTASQWISEELGTTIFNSNGSVIMYLFICGIIQEILNVV